MCSINEIFLGRIGFPMCVLYGWLVWAELHSVEQCVTTHCSPGKLCWTHGDPVKFLGGFPCISLCCQGTPMASCQENLNSGWSGLPEICLSEAGLAKRLFCSRCCTVLKNTILHIPTCLWACPAWCACVWILLYGQ